MTAATATAPRVSREVIEARWHAAVTEPKRTSEPDGRHSIMSDNSADYYRWEDAVAKIAMRLRGDHLMPEELEQVENIAAEIWDETLRAKLLDWAAEHAA
jgi:hypothetical protein